MPRPTIEIRDAYDGLDRVETRVVSGIMHLSNHPTQSIYLSSDRTHAVWLTPDQAMSLARMLHDAAVYEMVDGDNREGF